MAGSFVSSPPSGVKLAGEIFKGTVSGEIVVDRYAELWNDGKIVTYHDVKNEPSNTRTWYLDARCELSPRNEFDLPVQKPVSRIVRPRGTWTVTSRVRSQGSRVELYHFTLNWPRSWASKGYTSFTFGFRTPEEAQEWHRAISGTLAGMGKGFVVPAHAHSGLPMNNQDMYNVNTSNNSISSNAPAPETGGVPFFADRTSLPDVALNPNVPLPPLGAGLDDLSEHGGNLNTAGALGGSAGGMAGAAAAVGADPTPTSGAFAAAAASPAPLDDEAEQSGKQWRTLTESWVPYKQVNGVAIYHFEHTAATAPGGDHGGEFLVSTVIRGPPSHVLAALMHGSSHTTILGPASVVEVQSKPAAPGDKSQSKVTKGKAMQGNGAEEKVRLVLEAPGWAGVMCAPREMVVRRMLKTDAGMHVVLFSSVEKGEENDAPKQGPRKLRSWYRRPVTGNVRGTYIIAPLNGHRLDTSPETMITCILKVDLAGVCGDNSWFRPIADTLGWTDAFLDRILMTVILVRDEVEHSRFVLDWQQVLQDGRGSDSAEHRELVDESEVPAATDAKKSTSARSLGRMQSQFQRSGIKRGQSKASTDKLHAIDEAAAAAVAGQDGTGPVVAEAAPGLQEMQEEEEQVGGALVDLAAIKAKSMLDPKYWEQIHAPGAKAYPYKVRGPTYLKDKKKIPGGDSVFTLASIDMYTLPEHVEHVARFLPSVRESGAPFAIAINLIIPGNPTIGLVANFITERHPNEALGKVAPINPMSDDHDWQPFDFVLHKFVNGDDHTRNQMLKLIPHIANGSWVIRQSVGTTPVIIGKALKTTYYQTEQYLEVDIDVSANSTAAYVTGMVRGATTGLVIDIGFVLEGTAPWELPECLLGGLRLNYLETKKCVPLNVSREIPLRPAAKPSRGGA